MKKKQNNDYMSPFRNLKAVELLITIAIEIIYLIIILTNTTLRTSVFTNKLLFTLTCMMWVSLVFNLLSILLDLYLLKSSASQNQELTQVAYTDSLTGLPNRYSVDMMIKLHDSVETMANIGCAVLRIANLVEINDEVGRDAGDAVIQDFCNILDDVGSQYGFVGKNGGNEYLAIIEKCDDEKITQFISDLYVELNLYNLGHAATPIAIEYNYALNSVEDKSKMTELLAVVYRKMQEITLS